MSKSPAILTTPASAILEAYEDETPDYSTPATDQEPECSHPPDCLQAGDGVTLCSACGEIIQEDLLDNETHYFGATDTRYAKDPSRHNQRHREDRSLFTDLEPRAIPKEVIERADEYYKAIIDNRIFRAGNRLSIVFACTLHAYEDMHECPMPYELAKLFALDKKAVSNGLKIFAKIFRKRPDKKYIDAMDIVPKILADLCIDPDQMHMCETDIGKIYAYMTSACVSFINTNPQSLAAGLTFFYLKLNKMQITRGEFSEAVKMSDVTYCKIAQDINRVLKLDTPVKF